MIKAVIVDDELIAASTLQQMIERYMPQINQLRIATDFENAVSLINSFKPQLVFLDVVMPPKTGFEILALLKERQFEVIFTTAHNEYAVQAIRFSALDYLLKPIDAGELKAAITRFEEKHKTKTDKEALYENLLSNLQLKEELNFKLAIPTLEKTWFISPQELVRCEGESNYTWFYLTGNRKILASRTMKEYAEILMNHHFIRIHKSHLVNKKFIDYFSNEGAVVMKDKLKLPVSRQRKEMVLSILKGN